MISLFQGYEILNSSIWCGKPERYDSYRAEFNENFVHTSVYLRLSWAISQIYARFVEYRRLKIYLKNFNLRRMGRIKQYKKLSLRNFLSLKQSLSVTWEKLMVAIIRCEQIYGNDGKQWTAKIAMSRKWHGFFIYVRVVYTVLCKVVVIFKVWSILWRAVINPSKNLWIRTYD